MENEEILKDMVKHGFNDLYLEVVDAPSVKRALQEVYKLSDEEIRTARFERADEKLQSTIVTTGERRETGGKIKGSKSRDEKDDESTRRTEKYQLWMGIIIILLFGFTLIVLIFSPVPADNRELLVILATWLARDTATIIHYHHGSSYSSYLKTQSMIKNERNSHELNQTTRPSHRQVPDKNYMGKHPRFG